MSWRRTHDRHLCSFPPQSSATTTNHTHSNVRRTTVHQTDRLSCHHRNLRPSKQPFEKIWQGEDDKNHTEAALCLHDVMATTPWPTRFAVPRASSEKVSLRRYYATSRHSGNNVNKFPDWSAARALHMQSSWLDARLIDSSGRQKSLQKAAAHEFRRHSSIPWSESVYFFFPSRWQRMCVHLQTPLNRQNGSERWQHRQYGH